MIDTNLELQLQIKDLKRKNFELEAENKYLKIQLQKMKNKIDKMKDGDYGTYLSSVIIK